MRENRLRTIWKADQAVVNGWLAIPNSFSAETMAHQGWDSLVIDLRNNPGGLLDAAVEVAELFFKKGDIVVYTQGRKPGDREDFRSEIDGPPLDLPLAVLINSGSASAAEVAGKADSTSSAARKIRSCG